MDLPKRKHPRLKEYDYSTSGCYFITFCTKNRKCSLGTVGRHDPMPPKDSEQEKSDTASKGILLTSYGKATEKYVRQIPEHYDNVRLDNYIVMPNHVHLLLTITEPDGGVGNPALRGKTGASVPMIVRGVKSAVTKEIGQSLWQSSFFEHVIRNEQDDQAAWNYIERNAPKWRESQGWEETNVCR